MKLCSPFLALLLVYSTYDHAYCDAPCTRPKIDQSGGSDPYFIASDGNARIYLIKPNGDILRWIQVSATYTSGMYYDPQTQRIYLVDPLRSYNLNLEDEKLTGLQKPYSGLSKLEGDPINGEMYLTSSFDGIFKINVAGNTSALLMSSLMVSSMKVDTCARKLYWSNPYDSQIKWVNLQGNPVSTTVFDTTIHSTIGRPEYLDIDFENNKLYWCDSKHKIYAFDLKLNTNSLLANQELQKECRGLKYYNGHIYVTENLVNGIKKLDLTGNRVQTIAENKIGFYSPHHLNFNIYAL